MYSVFVDNFFKISIFLSCDIMITKSFFSMQVSLDGNVATTTVIFIPEVKDQDKILYCRAKNLHVSTKTVEDQWKIKVACKCSNSLLYVVSCLLCNWWFDKETKREACFVFSWLSQVTVLLTTYFHSSKHFIFI